MLTKEDKKNIGKIRFASEIESKIKDLDFQRKRIFELSTNNDPESPKPTHEPTFT